MTYDLRFQLAILPNTSWEEFIRRFQEAEALGFDLAGTGDHFTDWSNPSSPWFEMWTVMAAVAARTSTLRIGPTVAQMPLRNPAMFAREALTVDHISNGRLELGLGIGLTIDPSYEIMGIPNWSNKERVKRFAEYVEIVDKMLSSEITDYQGEFYQVNNAIMNPRPVQKPRPPITIAAMGPIMLKITAQYADTWNSLSFELEFEKQLEQTRDRIATINEHCKNLDRDPGSLRHSYWMLDMNARTSGGFINYWQSEEAFAEMVREFTALGISDISVYYPLVEDQVAVFKSIAENVIPELKAEFNSNRG